MDRITLTKLIITISILLLGIYLVYPIIPGILGGLIFSYAFSPVYNFIYNKIKMRSLSAALTTLFISAPFLITLLYGFYKAIEQLAFVTQTLTKETPTTIFDFLGLDVEASPFYGIITDTFPQLINISDFFSSTMGQLPLTLMNIVVLFLSLFYFLSEKDRVETYFEKIIPDHYKKDMIEILGPTKIVINGLIYANVMSAMIIALLATTGFLVIGVPYSFLLGLLTGLAALLPVVGPWTIFLPVGFYYLLTGEIVQGFAILTYGVIVLFILYNFYIFPKLGGNKAQLHPFIVLVGFLGGAYMFGALGILYGPIILGLLKGLTEGIFKESTIKRKFFKL
ncbi:MAG: putative inner membrane protein [Candidatus Methanofastidiosum methylothiophilum]|uniref:Putative inner membrane protein n=1 Tax=Candidatus Methanofastidiosum methylothiophilum TaxID=1705564 RepID=A0A150IZ75_9EURY|nr:MAG: putative inner membrane protein [Candidatus Methanofastidiosum methylthiophilus]KYC47708.1 MAG: putative inner membrane protein [Candidatus Methanofastidiosum methylthiophilus]KYC50286.1 MAG: putative inner membrane protein [Candidatus Methanofastidiosum methylthiophilus]